MSSQAQITANRANSQLSTGPTSEAGKAKSSMNAVKTGLTGATVLLPSDDVAAYERHIARPFTEWNPATDREKVLVQLIADTEWRFDAYIFQTSRRDLTNLSLQESRLRRQREKDLAELRQLQQERIAKREARLNAAAHMYERFKENEDPFDPVEFGFEFSFEEIEERCGLFEGRRIRCQYPEQFAKIHAADLRAERLAA